MKFQLEPVGQHGLNHQPESVVALVTRSWHIERGFRLYLDVVSIGVEPFRAARDLITPYVPAQSDEVFKGVIGGFEVASLHPCYKPSQIHGGVGPDRRDFKLQLRGRGLA